MKKLYTLFLALLATAGFAQPIITAIIDGPCPGGLPKVCEIYANGAVDFAQFKFQNQTNANTTWGADLDLSPLGIRTNSFVYVVLTGGNLSIATTEFPSITVANSIESGVMNLNGDDRVRIINTATLAVIDQFGVTDVDGTGAAWEWLDTYAKRNNGTGPDGGFVAGNWTVQPINTLDTAGSCLTPPGPQLQTIVQLGSYTLGITENTIEGLRVYPNPVTNGTFYIDTNANAEKTVMVSDLLGKQIINTKITTNAINVSNLKSGVYMVKITEEGKTATKKLIIK